MNALKEIRSYDVTFPEAEVIQEQMERIMNKGVNLAEAKDAEILLGYFRTVAKKR